MRLYKILILFILTSLVFQKALAQKDTLTKHTDSTQLIKDTLLRYRISPKREFRGVWIATVENIDWPAKGQTAFEQQQQLIDIARSAHRNLTPGNLAIL